MKTVEKTKLNKRHILVISVALLLAVLIAAYIIIDTVVLAGFDDNQGAGNNDPGLSVELLDGEGTYAGNPVAFPRLGQADITSVVVENKKGAYAISRFNETGDFWIYYDDGVSKDFALYSPRVLEMESETSYTDFYADMVVNGIAQGSMITYLCAAVGTLYFSERIEIPSADDSERADERANILREFGFTQSNAQYVNVEGNEKQEDGSVKEIEHIITIGDTAISGAGYYYMVDGRDYIYYHSNTYMEYALEGVETFIKGALVGEGLAMDGTFEPYLTTDFKQWKNKISDKVGTVIEDDSFIVCSGAQATPVDPKPGHISDSRETADGYIYSSSSVIDLDFHSYLTGHPDFERFKKHIIGQQIGVYYDGLDAEKANSDKLFLTILSILGENESKKLSLGEDNSKTAKYTYTVTAVESIITETKEYACSNITDGDKDISVSVNNLIAAGLADDGNVRVKLAYFYSIDGEVASGGIQHAVVDLSSDVLPDAARDALSAASVGSLSIDDRIVFDIDYSKNNSLATKNSIIISSISSIVNSKGLVVDKVDEDCYVTFNYYERKEGKSSSTVTRTVYMKDLAASSKEEGADLRWSGLEKLLLGRERITDADLVLYEEEMYYEIMRAFVCYEIYEIKYMVTYEPVVSFRFVNATDRDKYYGETYYENTLLDGNKLYGLNASACENVVLFLGGVGDSGSNVSNGFYGTTVALGLTVENMEKYGLYSNSIYFELPRGIIDISEEEEDDDENKLSDYEWFGTLGFNLYISDVQYDPDTGEAIRYIGSDMYDLIARVSAENFNFLDMDFTEFWARKNLVLMDVNAVDSITVDFDMNDVYGEYEFDLTHNIGYIYYQNGKPKFSNVYVNGATKVDYNLVDVTPSDDSMPTELLEMMQKYGYDAISLTEFYNKKYGYADNYYVGGTLDSVGTSNFMTAFEGLQLTRYHGELTEEEKAVIGTGAFEKPIMTMELRLTDREKYYVYEFYRVADRKIAVSLYCVGDSSEDRVQDFYITTYAFKKLVDNFVGVLNGEKLDLNSDYPGDFE